MPNLFNPGDKSDLKAVQGLTSGLKNAPEVWKEKPTLIATPSNRLRREQASHGSPFSVANLGLTRSQSIPNKTARQTMAPPQKRRKVDHFVSARGRPLHHASSSTRQQPIPSSADIIMVHDEDDQGVPLSRQPDSLTPDRMDLLNSSVPESALKKRKAVPPKFRTNHDDGLDASSDPIYPYASNEPSGSRPIMDGDATRALEAQINQDSDPILDPSSPSQHPPGRVQRIVMSIEGSDKPRQLDLRVYSKPSSIKKGMKSKNPMKQTLLSKANTTASTPKVSDKLYIEKWYYGTEFRAGSVYHLSWDLDTVKFWDNDNMVLWFDVATELETLQYSQDQALAIKFTTKRCAEHGRNHLRFKMGDKYMGNVVIWIDQIKNISGSYDHFIAWLKGRVPHCEVLRGPACHAMWERAQQVARMADQKFEREQSSIASKQSLKRFTSFENDDDSTPPPVGRLLRDSPNASALSPRLASAMTSRNNDEGVRRSTRRQRSPTIDPEEVILCYPQGIPGAVYIKNSDYRRLDPGEYLNDTLIEFGLKLWLRKIEQNDPELASQIHVFSSFFYKKLNNKNSDEGYESVRKWTAKIDIFRKKYIIVPINEHLHWYLVIICQPEHMLIPPPPPIILSSPTTRSQKKVSKSLFSKASPATSPLSTKSSRTKSSKPLSKPASSAAEEQYTYVDDVEISRIDDAEEERMVSEGLLDLNLSVTLETDDTLVGQTPDRENGIGNGKTPTEVASDGEEEIRTISPTVSDFVQAKDNNQPETEIHDVDMEDDHSSRERSQYFCHENTFNHASAPISTQTFYGKPNRTQGMQEMIPNQAKHDDPPVPPFNRVVVLDNKDGEDEPPLRTPNAETTTYIFTFDSLGSRHPQAIKNLTRYLKKEAQDKLGKEDTGNAVGRQAQVPVQPNYCDCGLYLLHFAETFMSDPAKYSQIIRTRSKGAMNAARLDDWKGELTGDMRQRLRTDIEKLSVEWKKEKKEAKRREAVEGPPVELLESSDDDIVDIVETTPAPGASGIGKATKKGTKGNAAKEDASVMRLR